MLHSVPFFTAPLLREARHRLSTICKPLLLVALTAAALPEQAAAQVPGFVRWSMYRSAQDSVVLRSAGISAASATLRRFVLSNGQMPGSGTTVAPYTKNRGQAFAPAADGSGWPGSATPPGPGNDGPKRTFYEQFAVTASAPIRFDSLVFTAAATSTAGGRVGLQYSLSNFTTDSANLSGGKGPAYAPSPGGTLPATADGSFPATGSTTPTGAALPQLTSALGNTGTFRFGLSGAAGIVLNAGQTLTVRMFYAINNSSPGRYILLKDVILVGRTVTATATARAKTALALFPNPAQGVVALTHAAAPRGATVAVYSATGRRVLSLAARPGATGTDLDLTALTTGIYLVEYSDGQQRFTGKIVKQ